MLLVVLTLVVLILLVLVRLRICFLVLILVLKLMVFINFTNFLIFLIFKIMSSQRILDTGNKIAIERPSTAMPQNHFDLSHEVKLSCNIGELIPCGWIECMPGDTFHISTEALLRFQPMIAPVMGRFNLRSEWFFVPTRLLWPNWEQFIGPLQEGATPPACPVFEDVTCVGHSLADYLGLPTNVSSPTTPMALPTINAFPFAAYNKIIWDWYTDEDLFSYAGTNPNGTFVPLADGNNAGMWDSLWNVISTRNKDRDYFTSAKPWPQKGVEVVIPSLVNNVGVGLIDNGLQQRVVVTGTGGVPGSGEAQYIGTPRSPADFAGTFVNIDPNGTLGISPNEWNTAAGTIDELRSASALQKFFERDARGGTRYSELLEQQYNVYGHDSRLQRAEYIGRSFQPVMISEVLQTSETATTPQGTMAGHGVSVGKSAMLSYHCEEHGYIMAICSLLPISGYYQGVPKQFLRFERLDFPFPMFAELGEQAIQNCEIYNDTSDSTNLETFGYVPRYTEMRMGISRCAGDFRSSLDFWQIDYKFATRPLLNDNFILYEDTEDVNRIFAVTETTVDHLLQHWFHKITVKRTLPLFVQPRLS